MRFSYETHFIESETRCIVVEKEMKKGPAEREARKRGPALAEESIGGVYVVEREHRAASAQLG